MAYVLMPSQTEACQDSKQQYINGHFCYADKFAILTNGLGIVRHTAFLDDDFKQAHPEMEVEKDSAFSKMSFILLPDKKTITKRQRQMYFSQKLQASSLPSLPALWDVLNISEASSR